MIQLITDSSSALCILAVVAAVVSTVRAGAARLALLPAAIALLLLAIWTSTVALYARQPFSPLFVHLTLASLCLLPAPWLAVALRGASRARGTLHPWRWLLAAQMALSIAAAALMGIAGIDWITGIGAEPAAVLNRWGGSAIAVATVPAFAALVLLAVRLPRDLVVIPVLLAGTIGVMGSVLWTMIGIGWRGYLSLSPLPSPLAVASVASVVWAAGLLQGFALARPLAPSRRLVYGVTAAALVLAYLLAARMALNWVTVVASAAVPVIVPVTAFLAAVALVITLGSRRVRHGLWITVGHYLFRSKHDYGEVWIHLTELVSSTRETSDFLARATAFCRDVLCVSDIGIWLAAPSGQLWLAAGIASGESAKPQPAAGGTTAAASAAVESDPERFAAATSTSAAFAMRLNDALLGFITVGSREQPADLDEEDRRVMEYIAAQVASAVALYRLADEIADAREVASFHRLSAFIIHDLKNLVAQQSFVLENAGKFAANPAFVADALAAFEDSTNRMRALITRLREREPGTQGDSATCDLLELLQELVAMPRLAQRAGCAVRVALPAGVSTCPVRADRAALAQVFSNLLVNAVESLPDEGGEVSVRLDALGRGWCVTVKDNGRGIPETYLQQHLFRPFRTTKDGGLGIGLYQCKTMVEAAGGTIAVHSQEHNGTTVAVTLPAWLPTPANGKAVTEERDVETQLVDR